jgi:hypothetical protein
MLTAHEKRFEWIVNEFLERPAGDYAELLRRGHVSSPDGADPEEWRRDIRRQARQDKVRVITSRDGDRAFAMLHRTIPADHEMAVLREAADRITIFGEIAQRSRALGHQPGSWLRHDDESITTCQSCGARIYVKLGERRRIEDGEALTDPCPNPGAV